MERLPGPPQATWMPPSLSEARGSIPPSLLPPPTGDALLSSLALSELFQNGSLPNSTGEGEGPGVGTGAGPGVAGVLIPLIYFTVCIIGLGGNTLVIHIVLRYSKTESVTNIYILNLAIADELFMLGLPFLAVQNALSFWPFGSFMCRLVMTVDGINQFTSIFCLTVMSIDRYLAVVHPIRSSRWRKPQVAKAVNGTVWAVSFVVVLPVVIFADVPRGGGICNIDWPQPAEVWRAAFIIYTSTLGFFGPLLVICLCYLLIVVKVRSSGKKVRATSTKRKKSERKVTRMVVIVVAVFVFCWLPFYALNIINLVVALPEEPKGVYFFVVVLSYANSCANPIVYGFLSDNFKRGFRKALCRSSRKVESQEQLAAHRLQPGQPGQQQQQQQQQQQPRRQGQQEEEEEEKRRRRRRQRGLEPMDVLRRRRGRGTEEEEEDDDDDDEEEEDGEATEMTEICHIAQNGNGQPETARALFLPKGQRSGTSTVSPTTRNPRKAAEPNGKTPDLGTAPAPAPCLLNGATNGSMKPLPEEPGEKNTLLEISYL